MEDEKIAWVAEKAAGEDSIKALEQEKSDLLAGKADYEEKFK